MKIKLICDYCNKEFYVSPCYAKAGNKHYCCKKCSDNAKKGKASWNKGLTKETDPRVKQYANTKTNIKFTSAHKKALSLAKLGKASPRKGVTLSKEIRKKISLSKKGQIPWIKGKHHTKEALKKIHNAKYGKTYSPQQRQILAKKKMITRRKNGTIISSKPELQIKELLEKSFKEVKYQYHSEKYPFACDFYIPELDLYIEYQGNWTHGLKPYTGSDEDLKKLKVWREKAKISGFYQSAIDVWTKRDPLKRKTAKKNKLNWQEFFTLNEFLLWLATVI